MSHNINDIVWRCRHDVMPPTRDEAADEIERLRAQCDELLAEFQRIVDCGDKMTNDSRGVSVWAIARAAIAKAGGRK